MATTPKRPRKTGTTRHRRPPRPRHDPIRVEPQTGGGGSSGQGPIDDDGDRRPERPNDDRTPLLIALGVLTAGALVLTARVFTKRRV